MFKRKTIQRAALSAALSVCIAGGAYAQSTTGSIHGTVPSASTGTTIVQITNNSGFNRTVTADANGRYNFNALPVGNYKVTVQHDGQVVGTREVTVIVGAGTDASFAGAGGTTSTLETVNVTATAASAIDLTAVDTRTVFTAEQLQRLPINRSAEAIALLAPGAVAGAGGFSALSGLVSFGGSGVSENAYYINGYFTGEPLSNLGGSGLPFFAIAQQETYTGGYSAKYGRSDGGVISQIGKRGTNDWEFGGEIRWAPKGLREKRKDLYLPNLDLPDGYDYEDPEMAGTIYSRGKGEESSSTTYSAYAGGPIVRDRLFFFAGAEVEDSKTLTNPDALSSPRSTHGKSDDHNIYVKLDWNINDNHMLEATWLKQKDDYSGSYYSYDIDTGTEGNRLAIVPTPIVKENDYRIFKYIGYLSDNLTLSATYGNNEFTNQQINPGILPGIPYVAGATNQDPSITGGTPIPNRQGGYQSRDGKNKTNGLRADLEWVVGDHTLSLGLDNIKFEASNEGTAQVADYWEYGRTSNPNGNLSAALGVGAPGGNGYFVRQLKYFNNTSMSLDQKAWYLEDRWQITDNLLLSLGVRTDQFTNTNDAGEVYMDAKNQWAPRLGFSWDVFGDSTLKVFGNAGRYFLAMPNNVAIRGASASTYTWEYFTYTGINSDGLPTGLTAVPGVNGGPAPGPVSSNGEYGTPVDVLAFAPKDLKNMYQDEYILGFEKQISERWFAGAKFTYRDLKSSIDDICDPYTLLDHIGAVDYESQGSGYNAELADGRRVFVNYCYMFNPGGSNTFSLAYLDANGLPTGERTDVRMTSKDWGFSEGVKRTYKAIDLFIEHPFDGTWEGRATYTYSKSQGNNEGQVKSEFGQTNISKTQDWDAWQMMEFANGYLANDRRHSLKLYGSYALTPEWTVAANMRVQSGTPISCLGWYNPDGTIDENSDEADPIGYEAAYHTCFGKVATPGSQRTPWTRNVDMSVTWRPEFMDKRLALSLQVFNVLNSQDPTQVDVTSETGPYTVSNTYLLPIARQTPRYVMFSASYNF